MDENKSIEIDEKIDWAIAEEYFKERFLNKPLRLSDYELIISDVDGVLTDAGMYYTENGDEIKKFSTYDGMAFKLFRDSGLKTGIITSEKQKWFQTGQKN